jgi:hypothetical protein
VDQLRREFGAGSAVTDFWKNLQTIYKDFESTRRLKPVHVNKKGEYYF